MGPNGIMLPGQSQAAVQVASPLNDIQLVALVAAGRGGLPENAVAEAVEIVAEAIVQAGRGQIVERVRQKQAEGR